MFFPHISPHVQWVFHGFPWLFRPRPLRHGAVPGVERRHGQEPHLAAAILHAVLAARLGWERKRSAW